MDCPDLRTFRRRVRDELYGDIIPFWLKHGLDREHGGFIGYMTNDLSLDPRAYKGLILNARLLWTFSSISRFDSDPKYLDMALRAYRYLNEHFWDERFGGAFWQVDAQGRLLDDKKKIYGQAFYIYALSEYCLATEDPAPAERAKEVFGLIEEHSADPAHGGYFETCHRDWTVAEDVRLSDKDMNEKKSMNNHLHVLEGYTNLYRVWPDPRVAARLSDLIEIFRTHILDSTTFHFGHFFDETWAPRSDSYTFGHDIEGAWLLCEAGDVLGRPDLSRDVAEMSLKIAQVVCEQGLDDDGGLFYEGRDGAVIDSNKEWWPQAEAVVGLLNAYQLSGRDHFLRAAWRCWEFIERSIVDRQHGEWFWRVTADGTPDFNEPKVSEWKSPYHNTRACLEALGRLDTIGRNQRQSSQA